MGKFLRYCSPDLDEPDYNNLLDISLIDTYIETLEEARLSPSAIYNCLAYMRGGQAYALYHLNLNLDPAYQPPIHKLKRSFI